MTEQQAGLAPQRRQVRRVVAGAFAATGITVGLAAPALGQSPGPTTTTTSSTTTTTAPGQTTTTEAPPPATQPAADGSIRVLLAPIIVRTTSTAAAAPGGSSSSASGASYSAAATVEPPAEVQSLQTRNSLPAADEVAIVEAVAEEGAALSLENSRHVLNREPFISGTGSTDDDARPLVAALAVAVAGGGLVLLRRRPSIARRN
jgi:hypothetical protein